MKIDKFDNWYEEKFKHFTPSKRLSLYGFVQLAWNHQQRKIDELREQVKLLKDKLKV